MIFIKLNNLLSSRTFETRKSLLLCFLFLWQLHSIAGLVIPSSSSFIHNTNGIPLQLLDEYGIVPSQNYLITYSQTERVNELLKLKQQDTIGLVSILLTDIEQRIYSQISLREKIILHPCISFEITNPRSPPSLLT